VSRIPGGEQAAPLILPQGARHREQGDGSPALPAIADAVAGTLSPAHSTCTDRSRGFILCGDWNPAS